MAVSLLWTGGWDSTFQFLRLVLGHRIPVIPYYLRDPTRPSTQTEILTMERIKARLFSEHPHTLALVQPTRIFDVREVAADDAITSAFQQTLRRKFMGSQYDWLARFCREHGIDNLELCIHRDDKAHAVIEPFVREEISPGGYTTWRMDPKHRGTTEYAVFGHFSFPIFNLTKLQMASIAEECGWTPLMHMTWFCHRPRRNQQPCGRCAPCLYTIEEGMGWRIPLESRVSSMLYRTFVQPLRLPARAIARRLKGRSLGSSA